MRHPDLYALLLFVGACGQSNGDSTGGLASTGAAESSGSTGTNVPTSAADSTTRGETSSGTATGEDASTTGGATGMSSTTGMTGATDTNGTTGAAGTTDATDTDATSTTGATRCGDGSLGPGQHTIELEHDGRQRTALVHIPAGLELDVAAPLVLNFHGFTMTAEQQRQFTGMDAKADAAGFIVVYPQGIDTSWNAGSCCGNAMTQKIDDVGFVRALVEQLSAQLCLDPRRIYATGMSNGGFMAHRLACEASDLFAAAAPVSAVNGVADCDPPRPMPVLMFNGTADLLVSYNGGGNFGKSAPATFAEWAERDGCTGEPVPGTQAGAASCARHDSCDAGVAVGLCTIDGMGHCWPGQAACPYGIANTDLSANDEMWSFFSAYTLP